MTDFRADMRDTLARFCTVASPQLDPLLKQKLSADCDWQVSHPINDLVGPDAVARRFLQPLRDSLFNLRRRDLIVIGGVNRRDAGSTWVATLGHYLGDFVEPLWGIAPSRHLVFLRSGEFYRLQDGRITAARLILDLPDLMRQTGRPLFPKSYGHEMQFPAPETQDGVLPAPAGGAASLDLVEAMLGDLHRFDPVTFASGNQIGEGGYWGPEFLWYGPAGIGSSYGWDGFVRDHRAPFLRAFPDRRGGNHYCRIGDGAYAAVSGWPSMTMTFRGDYLGVPADGRALTLRVMDFYRCDGRQIAENWVLLDFMDLLRQMGRDPLPAS